MPFRHEVKPADGIATVTASGPIDLAASRRAMADLAADPSFRPAFAILVDLQGMEYMPSPSDVLEIAATLGDMKGSFRGPVAVAVSGTVTYGLARMTCSYADLLGFPMRAFRSDADALAWIRESLEA